MLAVRPYSPVDAAAWDAVVAQSRSGSLLHLRDYMDYHADRFVDRSLLIERNGEAVAVFPANLKGNTVVSHGGLTYAGLLSTPALRTESTLDAFEKIGAFYRTLAVGRVIYKAVPHVFHRYPADEDLYALHRLGARLQRRDISSVIALREPFRFTEERQRAVSKARRLGLRAKASNELADFHSLLTKVLHKHDATPTHSLDELQLLQSRFPEQIVLYEVRREGELLAGAVIYDFGRVVHTQYLAASDEGRRLNALNFLLAELIDVYADRHYFSFGISTEQEGRSINSGLVSQKEYFGARGVVHDFYEWLL
ncbi:Acetyltransferase (GNAT) domain-containing protein [Dyella sp. OK004]|uniref:GNAT family N-acetyltransferase n=1 Tax=Dyella sp. OK004 TaxID=1855292 RepID=UPI0008E85F14|nr:GNAT family N-acetyltransferase [Dyella sp. OK004]SFS19952.1 Acetyltransferase (GNAT) domain-containing protein [Dyella sp. OK004]